MTDEDVCKLFGFTLEDVDSEIEKLENNDYSSWDFSKAITNEQGIPLDKLIATD